ncbi:MAG: hypothetical protein E7645_08380 [Ruminococcaceae bacterium]|nr:hypothetical protein [Oscillospiraceae bacterium]
MFGKKQDETKKVSCEEMVAIVAREFIKGADEKFLRKIEKTAKGGSNPKSLYSKNEEFFLIVSDKTFFFGSSRDVMIVVENSSVTYQLASAKEWRNFYEGIKQEIAKERQSH